MNKKLTSAKEVATYVHCPESWNLRFNSEESSSQIRSESKKKRSEDKLKWLTDFDAARKLTWAANVIIFLIFFLIVFFFFSRLN